MIHKLHSEMTRLVKRYLGYIIPDRLIVDIPNSIIWTWTPTGEWGSLHWGWSQSIPWKWRTFLRVNDQNISVSYNFSNNNACVLHLSFFHDFLFICDCHNCALRTVMAFYVEVIGKMLKVLLCDLKVLAPASCLDISPETGWPCLWFTYPLKLSYYCKNISSVHLTMEYLS